MNRRSVREPSPPAETDWKKWKKFLPLLLGTAGLFSGSALLFRMLWFDEILTVNLILKLPLEKIYFAYEIPNNHILFTMLEKIWFSLAGILQLHSSALFRIPVMITGCAALFLLSRSLLKKYSPVPVCAVCAAFACSSVWGHYSTAVRGYMLGFFLTVCAFLIMRQWMRSRRSSGKYFFLYGICSLLSLGTVPSNLAALAGVTLFFLPEVRKKKLWKIWSFSIILPLLALGIFYLPILPKFLGCIRLGEGWFSKSNAVFVLYTGALFPIAPLALSAFAAGTAAFFRASKAVRFRIGCDLMLILMPAAGMLLMKVPPFPRVFFPLTAVWLVLCVRYICLGSGPAGKQKRFFRYAVLVLQGIWSLFFFSHPEAAGDFLYGSDGKGDDYIAPYYVRSDFTPGNVVRFIRELRQSGQDARFFATFDADAPSLLFAAGMQELESDVLFMDILNRPRTLRFEFFNGDLYIIAAGQEDLEKALKRFSFREGILVRSFGLQKVYKAVR